MFMNKEFLYKDITEKVIRCFYNVHDELGGGFLESVYEKALLIELNEAGLKAEPQKILTVKYKNKIIGEFKTDIVVEDKIILELKAVGNLIPEHEAQLINYLKATGIKLGILVNFGEKLEFQRRIY